MANDIRIRNAGGTWVVRAGGAVLGESSRALELSEGDLVPVIYFPRGDLAMAFLDETATRTTCPKKGEATHYSIVLKSFTLDDAAWSYEAPKDEVAAIEGYVAFYPRDEVAVEQI
ncbi:DUF427 domain-containing protein [Poseidonocella sedimentorum]|uniref:Uncharacterized conserved protein, DUF427 family n=1 Tax=Poseidonocella sedimentorum TaxID=871652 RepID=A0A1I6CP82_9RHOB|nr:DUF427 domain-containing protein [Poseidonocella sedimentorum]SFQ94991.1 Uncharacterized conserved protein, DUF427 family [Poseidonocella sedimentorum]